MKEEDGVEENGRQDQVIQRARSGERHCEAIFFCEPDLFAETGGRSWREPLRIGVAWGSRQEPG